MNVSCRLIKIFDEYTADKSLRTSYQLIVRSLMYIMLRIRFDIIYSISMISRYVFNLTQTHWQTIKRIFRYLRETYQMKLIFREALKSLKDYKLELNKRSKHQTIHLRIRFQRKQWNHQLILKTSINRDAIHLRSRIYKANRRRKEDYLTTKFHDSVDMWCRIFSNDNDIREQSKNHYFDKEFSISRAN
jgi:hypothetical protein